MASVKGEAEIALFDAETQRAQRRREGKKEFIFAPLHSFASLR
jgi:hypothetical protein